MHVRVKLMGVLKDKTPDGGVLDLPDAATIESALTALGITNQKIQAVSINGTFERDFSRRLQAEDELTVIAPVAGG